VLLLAFLQLSLRLLQLCIQLVGFNLLRLLQTPESEQNFTHTPYNYVRTQLCIYACMSSSSQNLFPIHTHIYFPIHWGTNSKQYSKRSHCGF
jgi:hypothetical protein